MWNIQYNLSKNNYSPGDVGCIYPTITNKGQDPIYVQEVGVQFDWQYSQNQWHGVQCGYLLNPGYQIGLPSIRFDVPNHCIGPHNYKFGVVLQSNHGGYWTDQYPTWADEPSQIAVSLLPRYQAFVSRSLLLQDNSAIDPIIRKIDLYGFDSYTVGINVFARGPENIPQTVKEEIRRSDCLIAIATKRDLTVHGIYKTFEYLHGESGIAYGLNKPILILKEDEVQLGGIASMLPQLEFARNNSSLIYDLEAKLWQFRQMVSDYKSSQFRDDLIDCGIKVLAVVGLFSLFRG